MTERTIFLNALDLADPAERQAYLDRACAGSPELRHQVESLLAAHVRPGSFLDRPAIEPAGTGAYLPGGAQEQAPDNRASSEGPPLGGSEGPGTRIGPYRLLQQIGEGGMGVVFMAEQEQPVRRKVALKIIKPGMDSGQVVARFEAERQALALMDHVNIARVLDAGTAGTGRPYFVMELVHGVPITRYCDENQLTPRKRLELFVPVCQAIQHAHQKGIIHRDVKPSNILITLYDGKPMPKVIDFGVAKAMEQRLTERTLFTQYGSIVGTPEYMSPEQAGMSSLGVDTRSDVFSLGVLLYELLTGTTPLERQRLRAAAYDEVVRLIKEEEPPRPSTRLSSSGTLPAIAAARKTDGAHLAKLVRGELDWIVMKCLEKDRTRRYETANGLARDIERYLADEPVEACPPSAGYRLRKFARKNRKLLTTAVAFVALLLLAGAVGTWQAVRLARQDARLARAEGEQARHEREEAERARDRVVHEVARVQEINLALSKAAALRDQARTAAPGDLGLWAEASALAKRAETLLESGLPDTELTERVHALRRELEAEQKDRQLLADLAAARIAQIEPDAKATRFGKEHAVPQFRKALDNYGFPAGKGDPEAAARHLRTRPAAVQGALVAALDEWLDLVERAKFAQEPHLEWIRMLATALDADPWSGAIRAAQKEPDQARQRAALQKLAATTDFARVSPRSLMLLATALRRVGADAVALKLLRESQLWHPGDFWINLSLSGWFPERISAQEQLRYLTAALAILPQSYLTRFNLYRGMLGRDRPEEALIVYQAAHNPPKPGDERIIGDLQFRLGRYEEAAETYRRALVGWPNSTLVHSGLGAALFRLGKTPEAEAALVKAIALDVNQGLAHFHLGLIRTTQGRPNEAAAAFRQALACNMKDEDALFALGQAMLEAQMNEEAGVVFQKLLALKPKFAAQATCNLGIARRGQGKLEEAEALYHKALALVPDLPSAHFHLGELRRLQGRLDEAVAALRTAIACHSYYPAAHSVLGLVLSKLGRPDEALAACQRAIELDPKKAEGHCNLASVLQEQGKMAEAADAFRQILVLNPTHPWAATQLAKVERLAPLQAVLPAFLAGTHQPKDAAERAGLAELCVLRKRYAAAAQLSADAFAADPKRADDLKSGHRYNAACSAALAAAGKDADAGPLSELERARWREQALTWLQADLALRSKQLESGTPEDRKNVEASLRHWQTDVDLAGLRDATVLARLSADEQKACKRLWAQVEALLQKAQPDGK